MLLAGVRSIGEAVAKAKPAHQRHGHHGDQGRRQENHNSDCERSARDGHAKLRRGRPEKGLVTPNLGRPELGIQTCLDQSDKRRLSRRCVKGKTTTETRHTLQATRLNRIVLRIQQAISDHLSHLSERICIEASGGESSGP